MDLRTTTLMLTMTLLSMTGSSQWTAAPDIPTTPFDGGYSFAIGGKIYVGAGDELYAYDPTMSSWQARTDFPGAGTNRGWASAFVVDNKAYVGLGITDGNVFQTDLHMYDPVANTWTPKASFPGAARGGVGVFVVNNKAYFCGGTSTGPTFSDVYCYDVAANSWALVSTLPTGTRGFATAFAIGNYGYVYGGYYGFGNETAQMHRYDPVANTWAPMASFPGGGRQSAIGVVVNGKALVGMGHAGFMTGYSNFYLYDPANNAWTPSGTFSGGNRICPVAATHNGVVYLGSGYDMNFSPNNDWWQNSGLVGIEETSELENAMQLFPVPSNDQVTITLGRAAAGQVTLSDISGAVVRMVPLSGTSTRMDVSNLAAGAYTVRFTATDGSMIRGRLVKQ